MSLRLLLGLMVGAAIFVSPFANLVLLRLFPPPEVAFRVDLCGPGEKPEPGRPCGQSLQQVMNTMRPDGAMPPPRPGERMVTEAVPATPTLRSLPPMHAGIAMAYPAVGFAGPPELRAVRKHFLWINLLSVLLVMGVAVLLCSLVLRAPFRALLAAIGDIERGAAPPAWAFSGPTELRTIGQALTRLGAQLRNNLQERELMLAGLSHDLRSPLARIQAAVELRAIDGQDWSDTLRDVQEIDHIVGQCIDYARDGQDEPPQSRPLDGVITAALSSRHREGIELLLDAPQELVLRPQSLARAVRNLVDNACLHGLPPVRVRTWIADGQAVIAVEDGGSGIEPQFWSQLREPFVRGSRARNPGGAGLGLAIVQRVADIHNGSLRLRARSDTQAFAVELRLPLN